MKSLLVDRNDTIVDFSLASYKFVQYFGSRESLTRCFDKIEGFYKEDPSQKFEELAIKAIDSLAKDEQKYLVREEKEALLNLFFQLPEHDNIDRKLDYLKKKGAKLLLVLDKSNNNMRLEKIDLCA